MKYVFVCKHGQFRSEYAAYFAGKMAKERGVSLTSSYFGLQSNMANEERREILKDADVVYVMESSMLFDVQKVLGYMGEVECLNIPDTPQTTHKDIEQFVSAHLLKRWQI